MNFQARPYIFIILALLLGWWFWPRHQRMSEDTTSTEQVLIDNKNNSTQKKLNPTTAPVNSSPPPTVSGDRATGAKVGAVGNTSRVAPSANSVQYQIIDGLVVVTGDIVLGAPVSGRQSGGGQAEAPVLQLWENGEVPFHIQSTVADPERVLRALEMFSGTSIRFVPFQDQEDVLVFEPGNANCRSYLGRIGGKQPIFISAGCGPSEIAHEIMHALGFVHEQNRVDRDSYIQIIWDNIDEKYFHNFQVLPPSLMIVSGSQTFDYRSIMMYAPNIFAKKADHPTMTSKTLQPIEPSSQLSEFDVLRLRRAYSN